MQAEQIVRRCCSSVTAIYAFGHCCSAASRTRARLGFRVGVVYIYVCVRVRVHAVLIFDFPFQSDTLPRESSQRFEPSTTIIDELETK